MDQSERDEAVAHANARFSGSTFAIRLAPLLSNRALASHISEPHHIYMISNSRATCPNFLALVGALVGLFAGNVYAQDSCRNLCDLVWWESADTSGLKEEIARGADINDNDDNDWTPLHYALEVGAGLDMIAVLVAAGANLNKASKPYKTTPLAFAAHKHPFRVVKYLLDKGADPEAVSSQGEIILHFSAANPDPAVSELFVNLVGNAGATDRNGRTPLHAAAHSNPNPEVARLLLDSGAPLEAQDKRGRTAWDTAVLNRHPQMLAFLTEQGAQANVDKDFGGGLKALHHGVRALHSDGIAKLLIKYGADVAKADSGQWGGSPLHWSMANPSAAKLLLRHGADIESLDRRDRTPLFWSAMNANHRGEGAPFAEYLAVMEVFMSEGVNIDAADHQGRTPLIAALMHEADPGAVSMLLKHGADPNASDVWACSPLSVAKQYYEDSEKVVELLGRHGAVDGLRTYPKHALCLYNIWASPRYQGPRLGLRGGE